ncbi:hypothetical protein [Paenibacillus xylaniclasticus]|uniref:hypothetical protein n=1 Tax=Paenibacillus xylaniclasticus TaxID=588083 RepID=UPI000FD81A1E|nr:MULTISPECIES: hypothetical protein [Paenibacillus]GFN33003.1 hypothetical protein PCURB6_32630 [Paenibacillus curdlanolyticus]
MSKMVYSLIDDLDLFDVGVTEARTGDFLGKQALYLEKAGYAVLLKDEIPFSSYRVQAEVAIPEEVGFIGIVFGAKDADNYELIYLAPLEIQYDPVMNGSMTWQVYNGPLYQKPLPDMTGRWVNLTVDVQPNGAAVYLGEDSTPQLVIPNLQHGLPSGRIGFWGFLPSYIRNFTVEQIQPATIVERETDLQRLAAESFVTEWMVAPLDSDKWTKAVVEENGTLNLNRIYSTEKVQTVIATSVFKLSAEQETVLTFGFSDYIQLWVNDELLYEGDWKWNPPADDGRIRPDHASVTVRWKAGLNTIRAQVTNDERFGWGLCVKTGITKKK